MWKEAKFNLHYEIIYIVWKKAQSMASQSHIIICKT